MKRLQDKVVIVTGGASGIGAGTCEVLAAEGARVVVADLNGEGAEAQAAALRARGGQALALPLDVADEQSVRTLYERVCAALGGVDGLVNNAANTHLSSTRDFGIEDADFAVWDEILRVSLRGVALMTKLAIPLLRARGGGSIVNLSSGAALRGADRPTAYSVAKAGIIALTLNTAAQHGKEGIRCNAIAPGLIVTPSTARTYAEGPFGEMMLRHHLTPRLGRPDDVAWAIVWLMSDESGFVTGQCLGVDGGLLSHQPYWAEMRLQAPPEKSRAP
ncbi:MAG TPA: SDR family oxidoreductase [Nevskia sp.]|nr:SDR family oxidoreductase [Nevskia sp.]